MTLTQIENLLINGLNIAADQYQKDAQLCKETMGADMEPGRSRLVSKYERQEKEVREVIAQLEEGGLIRLWSKATDDCSCLLAAAFMAKIRDSVRKTLDLELLEDESILARYVHTTATLMGRQNFIPPVVD